MQSVIAFASLLINYFACTSRLIDVWFVFQAISTKSNPVLQYLDDHRGARLGLYGTAVVLGGTLLVAAFRVFRKYNTPQNKRKRNVSKNKVRHHLQSCCIAYLALPCPALPYPALFFCLSDCLSVLAFKAHSAAEA